MEPLDDAASGTDPVELDWIYLGHGEWGPMEGTPTKSQKQVAREPEWVQKWMIKRDQDLQMHQRVLTGGYPNRWGARIPIDTKWNLKLFAQLLDAYEDKEVVEWMCHGWPTGRLPTLPDPAMGGNNHKGATDYPEAPSSHSQR